eukprot:scaffold2613_cov188-Amphora_coffeaeformis.AAC.7
MTTPPILAISSFRRDVSTFLSTPGRGSRKSPRSSFNYFALSGKMRNKQPDTAAAVLRALEVDSYDLCLVWNEISSL